jgi:tankyrase
LLRHKRVNVNARDNWQWSPLHEACHKGKLDTILVLLNHGADTNVTNSEQRTPLELCESDSARRLFTSEFKKSELLEACGAGNTACLDRVLTRFNVNCRASDGRESTPLHLAAGYNRVRVVQSLLERGALVQARDKGGLIPLHNACSYGHFEVAKLLLEVNFDLFLVKKTS